jgi:6-pyruvoyl-tetrahydropterin synthase
VTLTVEAPSLDAQGFVADFYVLRAALAEAVVRFDHTLLLGPGDPVLPLLVSAREAHMELSAPPTAEHLAALVLASVAQHAANRGALWRPVLVSWEEEPGFMAEVSGG